MTEIAHFEQFVGSIAVARAAGRYGVRDTPEDIAGGIQQANLLSWRQPTRVVYLIADSPCHGLEFHSLGGDHYPRGSPGIDIKKELHTL